VARGASNLGLIYREEGKTSDAEGLLKRTVDIEENASSDVSPSELANSMNNLARLYREQGKYEAAEALYKKSLALKEQVFGADSLNVAVSLRNYAILLTKMHKDDEAVKLNKRAAMIEDKQDSN
jgi:tetratricopeptide (TPR) repeat protein